MNPLLISTILGVTTGYVGNKSGPRKSEIVVHLGAEYFGISKSQLDEEIEISLEEERNGKLMLCLWMKEANRISYLTPPKGVLKNSSWSWLAVS